jgi:PPK2 family polyphosphate:nucleotide phosphotransferase
MALSERLRVTPGKRVKLSEIDTRDDLGLGDKAAAKEQLGEVLAAVSELQERLYAEGRRALLVVIQAFDAGGKDGTIRTVFSGVNPQGCRVSSFKAPSAEELAHDYLWRIHREVPPRGHIGIWNRSHYEDVLVVRVDELVPEAVWRQRYDQINAFEGHLVENDVALLKIFLHVSRAEQGERLRERLEDPEKRWKFSPDDLAKRRQWDAYREAYEEALSRCSTEHAPWHVVPADRNWSRNLAVATLVQEALAALDPQYPEADFDPSAYRVDD